MTDKQPEASTSKEDSSLKTAIKRTADDAKDKLDNPDTQQEIENTKKPKIDTDTTTKFKCISAIVKAYNDILDYLFPDEIDTEVTNKLEAKHNITVGNYVLKIIFTLHCMKRDEINGRNFFKKPSTTSFTVIYKGKTYSLAKEEAKKIWDDVIQEQGLEYKDFSCDHEANWYGIMRLYLEMFRGYTLRNNELRVGHNNMAIRIGGECKAVPVSKYGLSGVHHGLLEGITFPPELRETFPQRLGPMTAWLCMLRSTGIHRKSYEKAVKTAMAHIPGIDEIIEITKNMEMDFKTITVLLAGILLMTSKQATRMYFPIAIFEKVWNSESDKKKFCNSFGTTNCGGWHTYKRACEITGFTVAGVMDTDKASQMVFHSIFGTFKEDLGVLSTVTDVGNWFTRLQMEECFSGHLEEKECTPIVLPKITAYEKKSCAVQVRPSTGVSYQVTTVPCFSGYRVQVFTQDFFDYFDRRRAVGSGRRSVSEIERDLIESLEELHRREARGPLGTSEWRRMDDLTMDSDGSLSNVVVNSSGRLF